MAVFIDTFLKTLLDFGLTEVLTLLMMITISYAVLTKSKIFGDATAMDSGKFTTKAKNVNMINMVLSLILGFLVFLSPFGKAIDLWFTKFFIHTLIILAVILGSYLISGLIGFNFLRPTATTDEERRKQKKFDTIILSLAAFLILLVFINAGGLQQFGVNSSNPIFGAIVNNNWSPETVSQFAGAALVIIVFVAAIGMLGFGSGIKIKRKKP